MKHHRYFINFFLKAALLSVPALALCGEYSWLKKFKAGQCVEFRTGSNRDVPSQTNFLLGPCSDNYPNKIIELGSDYLVIEFVLYPEKGVTHRIVPANTINSIQWSAGK